MSESDLDSVFNDEWTEDHRSGVVAVVGRPNVGKSTLINHILGQKIAAVSPKPQTTRRKQLGIYTEPRGQILFSDTPGIHQPQHKLGEYMVKTAETALKDADVILLLLDASQKLEPSDRQAAANVQMYHGRTPIVLVLNKMDVANPAQRAGAIEKLKALAPHDSVHYVSAATGDGVPALLDELMSRMPQGPRYYPDDQVSEVTLRTIAAETIREKVMANTEEEIPHASAVEVDSYQEREDGTHYISAIIYVERDSQKGIVVGKNGAMIKKIGSQARADLEGVTGSKVFLDLRVKVLPDWRKDERQMQRFGYRLPKDD